ncbi:MAG: hypothetical protein A3A65_03385 [Candidatus Chisholmbacteria bacterium RIFCSPLOWO2_01_FULL_49_14]|jgi:hypothetical protein|uniref:Uncharacterized protein n=1 Tax=Candidatus Chisholmbacteria bacterium RIFCSPLOWO2_01_FULL_49_14 TaxID=1797593 RepID=A0A1G1W0A8_9BACT|nr:MAG: hypothetical protein A3A65_03385 [Candidatus Chisholmbacteria bacterium RIFCSPLOWO2_01_FULL_49_14]
MPEDLENLPPASAPLSREHGLIRVQRGHPMAVDALDMLKRLRDERPEKMEQLTSREDEETESFVIESGDSDILGKIEDYLNLLQRKREHPSAGELEEPTPLLPEL